MSKRSTVALLFLSLTICAQALAAKKTCPELLAGNGDTPAAAQPTAVSHAEQLIDARVNSITSADALAKFFEDLGEIGAANHEYVLSMAELFYRDLGQDGVSRIVRNLLFSPRHRAQEAIISAFITHASGESSGARSLEGYFPKPAAQETALKWTKLGDQMPHHAQFMAHLKMALEDFKAFEYVYGTSINAEQAFLDVVEGLKGLRDSALVGQFMELFLKADRLTRQYIFDEVVELKGLGGGVTVVLKGSSSQERNAQHRAIESIFAKSLNRLQEEAYFAYKSNGVSNRPVLTEVEVTKTVALRFVRRMKYDLTEHDVRYTSEILAKHPTADAAVDAAMVAMLDTGAKMPEWRHKYEDVTYALHELLIVERNARGLSTINVDFRYGASVLSAKTDYRPYLGNLLEFHSKFDLRRFPALQQLAVGYFRRFPESLDDLHESQVENVRKFKADFDF